MDDFSRLQQHSETMSMPQSNHTTFSAPSLTEIVRARHSVRAFTDQPVSRQILEECFALAQTAPSNSNVQPWRVSVLKGAGLARVSQALHRAVSDGVKPVTARIPDQFMHQHSAMGHALYGSDGYNIPREDKEGAETATRQNYSFFGAPTALIVSTDSSLAAVDTLSVGMYVHTLCLLLAERGVAHLYQVSVVGYPDVLRRELGIGEEMEFLTGIAVGYEDREAHINGLRVPRDEWTRNVRFVDE